MKQEYKNNKNNGTERVWNENGKFFIQSNWGKGFIGERVEVSRSQIEQTLTVTGAPEYVIKNILG